jgi:hypothetical protein
MTKTSACGRSRWSPALSSHSAPGDHSNRSRSVRKAGTTAPYRGSPTPCLRTTGSSSAATSVDHVAAIAQRAAHGRHAARLLCWRRGSGLRAGTGGARDCYRTEAATQTPSAPDTRARTNAGVGPVVTATCLSPDPEPPPAARRREERDDCIGRGRHRRSTDCCCV